MVIRVLALLLVFMMAAASSLPASGQEIQAISVIGGIVYFDVNGNGIQDSEEGGTDGVVVHLNSGETSLQSSADDQGRYLASVTAGSWIVTVEAPEGWELPASEPVLVEVLEGAAAIYEVHLGLQEAPLPNDEGQPQEDETPAAPDPTEAAAEGTPTAIADESSAEDEAGLPFLLPESGSRLHPAILAGLLAATGLGVGGGLLAAGRRLQRKK